MGPIHEIKFPTEAFNQEEKIEFHFEQLMDREQNWEIAKSQYNIKYPGALFENNYYYHNIKGSL